MCLDDLTRTGVDNMGTIGILNLGRQIAQARVAGILHADVGVILGQHLGYDSVLEAGGLESHVPVVDTLNEIGNPLLRCGGVDVIDNLLLGLGQFTTQILLLILWHQTITGDV